MWNFLLYTVVAVLVAGVGGTTDDYGSLYNTSRALKQADLCDPKADQDSGYIDTAPGKIFYWLFESKKDADKKPLTIYLYGGPGASSLFGLFLQNGPCSVTPSGTGTQPRASSWTGISNMVWVDQPAGTGFSRGTLDTNSVDSAARMYEFLKKFMQKYPKYAQRDVYLNGPSYAGHFIPALGAKIIAENKKGGAPRINLKGMIIGNGNSNPAELYKQYVGVAASTGQVSKAVLSKMQLNLPTCLAFIQKCNSPTIDTKACVAASTFCAANLFSPVVSAGVNPYDIRVNCKKQPAKCTLPTNVATFLKRPDVRKILNVDTDWIGDSDEVFQSFKSDRARRYDTLLPQVVQSGVKFLNYAGDQDFICNSQGNENMMLNLEWAYQDKFKAQKVKPFMGAAATIRAIKVPGGGMFASATVKGAGHFAEVDKPDVIYNMLKFFYETK